MIVTGDVVARIQNNVRINSFKIHEVSDGVISSYENFSKNITMSSLTLPNSDSYIIYELVVGNYENVEMQLHNVTGLPSNLVYELIDYNLNDAICDNTGKCFGGVEKTFYLKIKYVTYNASGTNYNINLSYNFKEFSNVIAIGATFNSMIPSTATHLVFTDEKPNANVTLTDLSTELDMGVVGYLDGTTYKVSTRRTGIFPEANADCSNMFNGTSLTNIDLSNLDTSNVIYMSYMFANCFLLTEIDLSKFNTSKVAAMDRMFYHCESIEQLNVSLFDTSNVTTLKSMFNGCYKLISLDLSNFNTEKVDDMSFLFKLCESLNELNISSFNTSNVTLMFSMFERCIELTSLDISCFDTSNVTDMNHMFYDVKLKTLDLSSFNTSNVKNMSMMFHGCSHLREINISNFDIRNVTDMSYMFYDCDSLTILDLSNFNTVKVKNMKLMFSHCNKLKKIYVGDGWDISAVTNSTNMFASSSQLPNYDLNYLDKTKAYVGDGGYLSRLSSVVIDGVSYKVEEGMTWEEWANSSFNTLGLVVDTYGLTSSTDSSKSLLFSTLASVSKSDIVDTTKTYIVGSHIGGSND